MFYEDINITKRKTITNGKKYDFFIYTLVSLEHKLSNGKFGKGDTVISKVKDFKMLDDAAFFAANSLETEFFVLTTSFTTYLTRPVVEGKLKAVGKVVNQNKSQFIAESIVYDSKGREVGRGNGIFVRSKQLLIDAKGYQ